MKKKIAKYLQRIKGTQIYEQISKEKAYGGLNLINIKERILAIKTKLTMEAFEQKPETDNIIYQLGTHAENFFKTKIIGPKKEIIHEKIKPIITKINQYQKNIKNFKKRHKRPMKAKDYHRIIFPKEIKDIDGNIFQAIEPKLVSTNYLTMYNLLPFINMPCRLCRREIESQDHLFFYCRETEAVRRTMRIYLTAAGTQDQSANNIIQMNDVKNKIEIQIMSYFKHVIWSYYKLSFSKIISDREIQKKFINDISFYIEHIYTNLSHYKCKLIEPSISGLGSPLPSW